MFTDFPYVLLTAIAACFPSNLPHVCVCGKRDAPEITKCTFGHTKYKYKQFIEIN